MRYLLTDTLIAGLPLVPVVMGIYLVIRIRQDFDLTVDGSLTLGGALAAVLLNHGAGVPLAMLVAVAGAAAAGLVTTGLHLMFRIPVILAGLVMSIGMTTLNLRLLGRPSISLGDGGTLFSGLAGLAPDVRDWLTVAILAAFAGVFLAAVGYLLLTEIGLALRATGVNARMARAQGVDDRRSLALCLALANASAGLSGALIVQSQGFADSGTGTGTLLAGVGAVMLGELITRPGGASRVGRVIVAVLAGTLVYRLVLVGALRAGLQATDLAGITALTLVAAVALNRYLPELGRSLRRGSPARRPRGAAATVKEVG
ncbi:ABC transporter permease [Frankia sp. CNm7]|uniref:ABC transporter permease n=1 Tax=Frankia nepalensis TaxID=1836974 RepID=A0A937ULR4_9ACTN|nr:ABC transporter permease [Frankia nepalensis]MBL7499017.1 ABC transporter permease [Frankia nepalensis]MBL7510159.1 ABC transporter permease [Frankia nepalensis]MBL7518999.1 ABC transporter permease [Frankia nepalensis]MBL7626057.1 ABC transporter permease [Frankia nepalensis]